MFTKTRLVPWRGRVGLWHGPREEEHPLDVFHRGFDRLFDDLWSGFDMPLLGAYERPVGAMMPRMDLTEDDDRIRVAVELPGMEEKDIEVVLEDNILTITGEKKAETEAVEKTYGYRERFYGSFCRSVPLDVEIAADKVEATFDKGVLTVVLPKSAEARKTYKKIPIHTAGETRKIEKKAA